MQPDKDPFNPKVSIVIPVYNGSNYLASAIDSALSQTYSNIEVLVINDGSRDNGLTEGVAQSYGDKVRYYRKENGGVASALNAGVKMMTGDYFSWLSHDDIYFPNKIETQINTLTMMNSKDIVLYSNWEHIDGNSISLGNRIIEPEYITRSLYAVMNCVINGCTLLVPKKCFDQIGLFDESLPTTQDYDLWFRIARKYEFVHIPEVLVKYRIHPDQDSHKHPEHMKEQNELHTNFNKNLTKEEILQLEKSEAIFFIKRAIFYKNKFTQAENYTLQEFKCHIREEKFINLLECILLFVKYKWGHVEIV
jgi:glycosyltransferase involved in cell wall biosynthesis